MSLYARFRPGIRIVLPQYKSVSFVPTHGLQALFFLTERDSE